MNEWKLKLILAYVSISIVYHCTYIHCRTYVSFNLGIILKNVIVKIEPWKKVYFGNLYGLLWIVIFTINSESNYHTRAENRKTSGLGQYTNERFSHLSQSLFHRLGCALKIETQAAPAIRKFSRYRPSFPTIQTQRMKGLPRQRVVGCEAKRSANATGKNSIYYRSLTTDNSSAAKRLSASVNR